MDPLSVLSLAGTAIQFVDFGSKIVSASLQLYSTSRLDVHAQAAVAVNDLLDYSTKLQQPLRLAGVSGCLTEDETALEEICHGCIDLAQGFIERLDELKIRDRDTRRVWSSLRQALLSVWTQGELNSIRERLVTYRQEIDSRVLRSLRQVRATISVLLYTAITDSQWKSVSELTSY